MHKQRCFKIVFSISILGYEKFIGNSINLEHGCWRAFSLCTRLLRKWLKQNFRFGFAHEAGSMLRRIVPRD